tara:strand:- start:16722 stop:17162 length:441 start_codon:yes stop_codon:yes gene_type:complete
MSMLTVREIDFDFSGIALSDAEQLDLMVRLMFWGAGIRRHVLKINNIKGRTKIDKAFTESYMQVAQQLRQDDPSLSLQASYKAGVDNVEKRREEGAKAVLEQTSVYQWFSTIFTDNPMAALGMLQAVTGNLPDGIQIDLTTHPSWL